MKENQRWKITHDDFERFKTSNEAKITELQEKYILMYRQGRTVKALKRRTKEDFDKAGIIHNDPENFAEWTIYNFVMQESTA